MAAKPKTTKAEPESVTLTFTKSKETKNTVQFSEDLRDGEPTLVNTLYPQKWFASTHDTVTVVITPE